MSHQRNGSKKRSAEDNQRHGACNNRRHRHKTGGIPERSSTCSASTSSGCAARRGRRCLTIRVGGVTEERALHFAQLAYVLYQRGQVQVGRVQHSRLIRPFETVGTLRESGFKSVGAGALDHVDKRPGVENDRS